MTSAPDLSSGQKSSGQRCGGTGQIEAPLQRRKTSSTCDLCQDYQPDDNRRRGIQPNDYNFNAIQCNGIEYNNLAHGIRTFCIMIFS